MFLEYESRIDDAATREFVLVTDIGQRLQGKPTAVLTGAWGCGLVSESAVARLVTSR